MNTQECLQKADSVFIFKMFYEFEGIVDEGKCVLKCVSDCDV